MLMLRKISFILILILMLILISNMLVFGSEPYEGTTLNIISSKWDWMETLLGKYGPEIADDMGITLQISWNTFDGLRSKIISDFAGGVSTWDLIYVDAKHGPEFVSIGALEPLDKYVENDSSWNLQHFFPACIDYGIYDGVNYLIPIITDTVGLVYRTDIFNDATERKAFQEKYGYELTVPYTYDQFMDVAEFFTRKKGETLAGEVLQSDFYGTSQSNKVPDFLWHDYITYMYAFGAEVYDPKTRVPLWDSKENIEALKYYKKLCAFLPPGHLNMTSGESQSEFDMGRVAMIIEFYSRTCLIGEPGKSQIVGKYAYDFLPTQIPTRPKSTFISNCGFGIYSKSKNKEAAAEFLKRLTSVEYGLKVALHKPDSLFRAANVLFPSPSVLLNPEVLKQWPMMEYVEKTIKGEGVFTFQHPRFPEYSEFIVIAATSMSEILAGSVDLETAVHDTQKKLEDLLK